MDEMYQSGKQIGMTESVCPECLKVIPAKKIFREGRVFLEKTCPDHGKYSVLIWEGSEESYKAWGNAVQPPDQIPEAGPAEKGCPLDCGLCEAHERKGCCVLLEVTNRCSLHCPVCFANAGENDSRDIPMEELERQMDHLMSHGGPFNLQLSGGEPTMRDDLPELIQKGKEKGFTFFQLNTNGLRLAKEPGYAEALKEAGLSCVFLQFDGLTEEVYKTLRGRPLLQEKLAAIDACERAGLGVVLVPVLVPGINEDQTGAILDFAVSRMPAVRGIHIQPVSYFGRCLEAREDYRLTIPKLLELLETQTDGRIRAEDFTGGNATNPYCTFQANYLRKEDGTLKPMPHGTARAYATSSQARKFVERQWSGPDAGCCCEDTRQMQLFDASSMDVFLAKLHNNTFAVSGMLFQDAYNLDLARLRRCYILETDSRYGMVPFCAYNLTSRKGETLYR